MQDLTPIETTYNNHRFRSRLEARWAVFFDALNIKWEYEVKWYNIKGDCYLPDFWLSDYKIFAEMKPTNEYGTVYSIPVEQIKKTMALAFAIHDSKQKARMALFLGTPSGPKSYAVRFFVPTFDMVLKDMAFHPPNRWEIDPRNGFGPVCHFSQCIQCGQIRIKNFCDKCNRSLLDAHGNIQETVCIQKAYKKAQTARFPETMGERIKNKLWRR